MDIPLFARSAVNDVVISLSSDMADIGGNQVLIATDRLTRVPRIHALHHAGIWR